MSDDTGQRGSTSTRSSASSLSNESLGLPGVMPNRALSTEDTRDQGTSKSGVISSPHASVKSVREAHDDEATSAHGDDGDEGEEEEP